MLFPVLGFEEMFYNSVLYFFLLIFMYLSEPIIKRTVFYLCQALIPALMHI